MMAAASTTASKLAKKIGRVVKPSQPKCRKAADKRLIKKRSPRLVTMGSKPRRSCPGHLSSASVIVTSASAIPIKNIAVGHVQAIQLN